MKRLLLIIAGVVCLYHTHAQVSEGAFGYFNDALLFSYTNPGGTARMQAIGGAQTALGGDPSAAYSNPAGLGFYNRSTFSITPSLSFNSSTADFLGQQVEDYRGNFNVGHLGLVINKTKGDYVDEKFKGGSIGISLTRINDFQRNFTYEGYNDNNSIIDFYLQQANGIPESNIDGLGTLSLAYYNYLINPVPDQDGQYDSFILGFPRQSENVERRGSQYSLNLSYGGNYDDKLYFGAGVGINTFGYQIFKTFREDSYEFFDEESEQWVADDAINDIVLEEDLRIDGVGINATFGLIYRPMDVVRVGLSYTSPTINAVTDESSSVMFTNYNNFYFPPEDTTLNSLISESDISISNYTLRTPGRLNLGASVFIGKNGFISGDVEFVNYAGSSVSSSDFSTTADNESIENLYANAINYRLGGEFRVQNFMIRGGYSYMADPIANSQFDRSVTAYSFGLGYRVTDYYVDLTWVSRQQGQLYSPYNLGDGSEPVALIDHNNSSLLITVGFNF